VWLLLCLLLCAVKLLLLLLLLLLPVLLCLRKDSLVLCWLQNILVLCWLQYILVLLLLLLLLLHLGKGRRCWPPAALLNPPTVVTLPPPLGVTRHEGDSWRWVALCPLCHMHSSCRDALTGVPCAALHHVVYLHCAWWRGTQLQDVRIRPNTIQAAQKRWR
jgi:hypothetical protein